METQEHVIEAKKWRQFLAAFIAALSAICCGTALGWTSPSMSFLRRTVTANNESSPIFENVTYSDNDNEQDYLTDDECSLVGSLLPVGALFGALSAGFICDKIGRKTTLQITNIPLIAGWIIICCVGRNAFMIFVARILHGIVVGCICVSVPLYNEEIAEISIRGSIGVFYEMGMGLGILWVNMFGAITTYFWINISCVILALLSISGLFFIPESPIYLLKSCETEKAENALLWLRGADSDHKTGISSELVALQKVVDAAKQRSDEHSKSVFYVLNFKLKDFKSLAAKSFYIIVTLMILRMFCGTNPFTFYTVNVFEETGSNISPFTSSAVSRFCGVVFSIIASGTVDRIGRRTLLLISTSIMIVSLMTLFTYFVLQAQNYNLQSVTWLPVACVVVFLSMYTAGLGSLPFFMMAEIVPMEAKKWITGVCCMIHWLSAVIDISLYFVMIEKLGFSGMFLYYTVIDIIGLIFIFLFVPETKNKPVETIHKELQEKVFHFK